MTEWAEARLIASNYHSAGPTGIGFAQFASTNTVTPELWDNIRSCEQMAGEMGTEGWAEDMARLRELLAADGIEEQDDNDKAADRAASALQTYHMENNGGESYGDEGSDEFEESLQDLLTDLRHLAWRSGVDYLTIDDAASNRYMEEISGEFQAASLIAALKAEGLEDVTCEDTGGGTATIIIDGGAVQIGPGSFGGYGPATFDTEELSYSFYDSDAEEIENSYRKIEPGTSVIIIAAQVATAYRAHKIAKGEK